MSVNAANRLATYGTLAPGRVNEGQLADLTGTWSNGTVRGRLLQAGWGADLGYPGMIPDDDGDVIEVFIFTSADLPDHWTRLDAFEGEGYRRARVPAITDDGEVEVSIYVLADPPITNT